MSKCQCPNNPAHCLKCQYLQPQKLIDIVKHDYALMGRKEGDHIDGLHILTSIHRWQLQILSCRQMSRQQKNQKLAELDEAIRYSMTKYIPDGVKVFVSDTPDAFLQTKYEVDFEWCKDQVKHSA
jgi:hypothetical protein